MNPTEGDPDLSDFSVPLMDMGLDSLSAVEFRNRVQVGVRVRVLGDVFVFGAACLAQPEKVSERYDLYACCLSSQCFAKNLEILPMMQESCICRQASFDGLHLASTVSWMS